MATEFAAHTEEILHRFTDALSRANQYARLVDQKDWDSLRIHLLHIDGSSMPQLLLQAYLESFRLPEHGSPLRITPAAQLNDGTYLDPIRPGFTTPSIAKMAVLHEPLQVLTDNKWGFREGKPELPRPASFIKKILLLEEELSLLPEVYSMYERVAKGHVRADRLPAPKLIRQLVFVPSTNRNSFRTLLSVSLNHEAENWASDYNGFLWIPGQGDPMPIPNISFEHSLNPNADPRSATMERVFIPIDPVNAISLPYVGKARAAHGIFTKPGAESFLPIYFPMTKPKIKPPPIGSETSTAFPFDLVNQYIAQKYNVRKEMGKSFEPPAGGAAVGAINEELLKPMQETTLRPDASSSPLIVVTRVFTGV